MDPSVQGAVITAVSIVVVAFFAYLTAKIGRVHNEIKTNHGKRAGEYLEANAVTLEANAAQMEEIVSTLSAFASEFIQALADHTANDTENFEELIRMVKNQDEKVVEVAALHRAERKRDQAGK